MTQYLLSVITPSDGTPPAPDDLAAIMSGVQHWQDELRAAGAWVFSGGLQAPSTASVVRAAPGEDALVTDGPFVEAKEYVGGFTIISADDLDAALGWAEKVARVIGLPIEVRPFEW